MGELDTSMPSVAHPSETSHTLSHQINAATRSLHTQLNRQIISRLPLALPPYGTNPSKYVSGLLHIAPIYTTFESLWEGVVKTPYLEQKPINDACGGCSSDSDISIQNDTPKISPRIRNILLDLWPPGLLRTARLRSDIASLSSVSEQEVDSQLRKISQEGKLANFISHTTNSVARNPHVLVAYTWVMYMALFSGGRILRASLQAAGGSGKEFWEQDPSPVRPYSISQESKRKPAKKTGDDEPKNIWASNSFSDRDILESASGLEFFNFNGEQDGEDIKIEYKKRFTELDDILTTTEKQDIVTEAQHIFQYMLDIVSDLDALMETSEDDITVAKLLQQSPTLMASRDSVSVAQERKSRETESLQTSTFLELLTNLPTALPILQTIMKPLGRQFSKEGPRGVSFAAEDPRVTSGTLWVGGIAVLLLLPAVGAIVAFMARYVEF
ncbi:hypothetical protein G7Y89_g11159 [Cudoniella acicularis]|uniref:Heme oxygenase n=1 Tax=Cudoniella acicularis TaxID=354080 RepID=A0A8H4VY39_9HELO|nr:hypothetical protein G7Y89_g11159 [Cudoniella acicularis]